VEAFETLPDGTDVAFEPLLDGTDVVRVSLALLLPALEPLRDGAGVVEVSLVVPLPAFEPLTGVVKVLLAVTLLAFEPLPDGTDVAEVWLEMPLSLADCTCGTKHTHTSTTRLTANAHRRCSIIILPRLLTKSQFLAASLKCTISWEEPFTELHFALV